MTSNKYKNIVVVISTGNAQVFDDQYTAGAFTHRTCESIRQRLENGRSNIAGEYMIYPYTEELAASFNL